MAQLAPAGKVAPHVLVFSKSAASEPVTVTPVITSAELPVFVRVSVCAVLALPTSCGPKVRLAAEGLRVSGSNKMDMV
jgi:hypothetical protein